MQKISIVSLATLLLIMSACNSGGARRVTGKQCPANYNVAMTPGKGESVISLDPAAKQMAPGTYVYQSATAYFHDKKEDFRVEITDAKDAKNKQAPNQFKTVPTCVRNAKGGLMLGLETQGINGLEVQAGANGELKTIFDLKSYGVTVVPGSMKVTSTLRQQKVEAAPGKAYENVATPLLIKKNEVDYELRSAFEDAQKKVFLIVRFKLTKPAAAVPAKKP